MDITLNNLKANEKIVIKPCDKGGGICILNTCDYISKMKELLRDTKTYKPLRRDPTNAIRNDIMSTIDYLHNRYLITDETKKLLTPLKPARTPLFYGLPKTHKENIPLRPIVSACDSPTDNISRYITQFLQPLAESHPSYIKDSKDFINAIQDIGALPKFAHLVTADVTSLYTNIPHQEGIDAIINHINAFKDELPRNFPYSSTIKILIESILKHNNFSFMEEHYLQVEGTAMGSRMAPPYANIFMGSIEQKILKEFQNFILLWRRFIDDIFFIFLGSTDQLELLKKFMNQLHPTIKFTFNSSTERISFLDISISLNEDRTFSTNLYRKPTACSPLLHFKSNHSIKCKENIIYSQALRYSTLISNDHNLQLELDNLSKTLIIRGYPLQMISRNIDKALSHPRSTLLRKTDSRVEKSISTKNLVNKLTKIHKKQD